MNAFTDELSAICRHFALFEKLQVCCGDVTVPQCSVLQELRSGPLDMSTLSARSGSSVSAMTRLVDGLDKRGWTERARDEIDRRRVVVRLTKTGTQQADVLRAMTDGMVQQLFDRMPKNKRKQIVESMRLVREAMDDLRGASQAVAGEK